MANDFRILFVADVVGSPGREAVKAILPDLKNELSPHLTVLNGENSAGGFGITAKLVAELKSAGADVITTGNHVFAQKDFLPELPKLERVLRPANYPPKAPGQGWCLVEVGGHQVLVMNLMGRIFVEALDDPFRTADARVLPGGTAYVTDVGMVGPRDGCIGMDKDVVLQRFLTGVPTRFVVGSGPVTFNSVLVTINSSTGRATSIQRIDKEHS